MALLNKTPKLTIVIPTLNEAKNIPLLLADLQLWPYLLEIYVSDGGSSDLTIEIARLAGAKIIKANQPNRGNQLRLGGEKAKGDWILFIHADCRLPKNWAKELLCRLKEKSSNDIVWHFDFRVNKNTLQIKLLELVVNLRSYLIKKPYGDQGLLIKKELYKELGGYKPIHIMEDIDLISRLPRKVKLKSLKIPLFCNARRWRKHSVLLNAYKNANLRRRWIKGEEPELLYKDYYSHRSKE